jgi:aspartyl-tRNA(Asn)/glutamyl-tRNA(Gln) amidotransferase subunit A
MYAADLMTVNVNLSGLPALVLKGKQVFDQSNSLPVGLQLIGKPFGCVDNT